MKLGMRTVRPWVCTGRGHAHSITQGKFQTLLGGSWVVISRVISPLIWAIIVVTLPIILKTTHEPPSADKQSRSKTIQALLQQKLTLGFNLDIASPTAMSTNNVSVGDSCSPEPNHRKPNKTGRRVIKGSRV